MYSKIEIAVAEVPARVRMYFTAVLLCHLQLKVNVVVDCVEPVPKVIVYLMEIYNIWVNNLTLIKVILTNRAYSRRDLPCFNLSAQLRLLASLVLPSWTWLCEMILHHLPFAFPQTL